MNHLLKAEPGKNLKKFWHSYDNNACFKNVEILKADSDVQKFESFRDQVLQALHDNLCQRFPFTDVLAAARVLCKDSWPDDTLRRALYGENEVPLPCKTFHFDSELSADILLNYTMYKRNGVIGAKLKTMVKVLDVLPIASADCERGFSQMNLHHSSSRNRLVTQSVGDLR